MKKLGLIGNPLHHSLSPEMHAIFLSENNIAGVYERLQTETDALSDRVKFLIENDYIGFNITIPFKRDIIGYLVKIDDDAAQIGAVNTVKIEDGKLYGFNTDGTGFIRSLQNKNVSIENNTATVFGAGGAARAVVFSLIKNCVKKLNIINRSAQRGLDLVQDIRKLTGFIDVNYLEWNETEIQQVTKNSDILVNSTSIGMWPDIENTPVVFKDSLKGQVVVDLVYNPLKTTFLKNAEKKGGLCIDGLDMFIYQGAEALQIWTDQKIKFDYENLRKFLIEKLENYGRS